MPFETTPLRAPAESGRETRTACHLLHSRGLKATPSKSQLVAYEDDRILRIRIVDGKRRAAARLARRAFRRLSEPAG